VAQRRAQFFLADLVALIAVGGLALAFVRSIEHPVNAIVISLLIAFVVVAWKMFRMTREAPACAECGRRFIAPTQKTLPTLCPQCGQPRIRPGRTRKDLAVGSRAVLAALVLAVVVAPFLPPDLARVPFGLQSLLAPPLSIMVILTIFSLVFLARYLGDVAQLDPMPCEKCGCVLPPNSTSTPLICPRCRLRCLPEKQLRKKQATGFGIILALLLMVSLEAGFRLADFAGSHFGLGYRIAVLVVVVATMVGSPVVLVGVLVILNLVRGGRLRSEPFILARARKVTGDDGEVLRSAQATVWYTGPKNPVPQLMEQMDATRTRLESLLGRELVSPPPIRILVFEKRSDFQAFFQPLFAHLSTWLKTRDGIYIRSPHRILALSTEEISYQVVDLDKTAYALFSNYFMIETSPDKPPAAWLQRGICKTLCSDPEDRARLNRKMLVSLSKRTSLAADLFKFNDKELVKLIKGLSNHSNFQKLEQYGAESWSVCEYLTGNQAPAERQDRFKAFMNDDQSNAQPEEVFKRCFGFGFDHLFENWQEWVHEQGIGNLARIPPLVLARLLNHTIPLIEDRQARREERILSIRNMGAEGYVVGAGALIRLLGNDDAIPAEAVIWALEAISGMAYGDDNERWAAWWSSLPVEIREGRHRLREETETFRGAPERSSFATAGDHAE
jgi:predicted RNA-binding Zn-ribbon protein involved in translation (DUF1610 family)